MPESAFNAHDVSLALFCDDRALRAVVDALLQRIAADIPVHLHTDTDQLPIDKNAVAVLAVHGGAVDALAITQKVRATHDSLPVCVVAPDDAALFERALLAGADECLSLPLREVEASARLRRWIAVARQQYDEHDELALLRASMQQIGQDLRISEDDMLASFDRLAHFHDAVTGAHERRVGRYTRLLAQGMGLPDADAARLERIAPLHDIGKIGIAASLLNKNGKLTTGETSLMRSHSQMGYEILANSVSPVLQSAATIALSHHERFDGDGYPQGLRGEQIAIEVRIVGLADVYDALTSERPYKRAWSWEQVLSFITENRTTCFDPELVDVFLREGEHIRALQTELMAADS